MIFVPDTYVPNNIYLPFYSVPVRTKISLSSLIIDMDSSGISSVITLVDSDYNKIYPYVDLSKFDEDTKGWFWYDSNNYPYRMSNNIVSGIKTYSFSNIITGDIYTSKDIVLSWDNQKNDLYTIPDNSTIKLYKYSPIILLQNGIPVNDLTDYSFFNIDRSELFNANGNLEFYYDFGFKCYTNKDLTMLDIGGIDLYLFQTINTINVHCDLAANLGSDSDVTPYVDNYMVKLSGQHLRNE